MDTQEKLSWLNENVSRVRERIAGAARAAGRRPEEILLCAASKTQDAETVRLSAGLSIDIFGENRVQELCEKWAAGAYLTKPLHFIGHLQRNKVKQVVGKAGLIQSVDSAELLDLIHREAVKRGLCQEVLLEVNIGGEMSKSGVSPEELPVLLEHGEALEGVQVRGLMAIPPRGTSDAENRAHFARMSELFTSLEKYCRRGRMDYLSMGMSADFENAILEGANLVRVGTAIYGARGTV